MIEHISYGYIGNTSKYNFTFFFLASTEHEKHCDFKIPHPYYVCSSELSHHSEDLFPICPGIPDLLFDLLEHPEQREYAIQQSIVVPARNMARS